MYNRRLNKILCKARMGKGGEEAIKKEAIKTSQRR